MYKIFTLSLLVSISLSGADQNLLVNSDFSKVSRGNPVGWILIDGNKKWGKQGTIKLVPSELRKNGKMLLINRTATDGYYPQLRSGSVKVKPGVYTAKLWVKCPTGWVFRYFLSASGKQKKERKPGINYKPFNDFQEAVVTIKVPKGYDQLAIGAYTQAKAQLMVDRGTLTKGGDVHKSATAEADVDPIHGLREFASRTSFVPENLRGSVKEYPAERLVFRDTDTGAEIIKMTRYPGSTRHVYSNALTYDADGGNVFIRSTRGGSMKTQFFSLPSDGSKLVRHNHAGRIFDAKKPDTVWCRQWPPVDGRMKIYSYNIKTGEKHVLPGNYPTGGIGVPHPDGKKLLVTSLNQNRTARRSSATIIDIATGKAITYPFPYTTHQVWFTKTPDYMLSFNLEKRNKYVAEKKLEGSFLATLDGKWRKVRDKHMSHRGFSPDGKRVAFHHGGIKIMNIDGSGERLATRHGGGHLSWMVTPEWFLVTAKNSIRCIGANKQEYDYIICRPNTQLYFSEYNTEAQLDSSPDGTKIGYASSMLQDTDFYQAISRLPLPPRGVFAQVHGEEVKLTWQAPARAKEVKGYFIYMADSPNGPFKQLNAELVSGNSAVFKLPPDKDHAYYYVSSVENSGLEGQSSYVVCAAADGKWTGPFCRYFELETETGHLPLREQFDPRALELLALLLPAGKAQVKIPVEVPMAGEFQLYLRAKGKGVLNHTKVSSSSFKWFDCGKVALNQGKNELSVNASGSGLLIDAAYVTNAKWPPHLRGIYDATAPQTPSGLKSTKAAPYDITLEWSPVKELDLAYYNVYASRKPDVKCVQAQRISSPLTNKTRDWGLTSNTDYYYRVTAIDRRGNESLPSSEIKVHTPQGGKTVIRQKVGKSRLLPLKSYKFGAPALKKFNGDTGTFYNITKAGPLKLQVNIPETGKYVIWLKLALAQQRGSKVRVGKYPSLRVSVGKKTVNWNLGLNRASLGHGGPVPGLFVWDLVGQAGDKNQIFELKKGIQDIIIRDVVSDGAVNVAEIIVTDDFGFEPEGIVNWMSPGEILGKIKLD